MRKLNTRTMKPFARLLTMLGEQLIKNEKIALVELIKNAYDADADWAKVSFEQFDSEYNASKDSRITIIDNGDGMSLDTIERHWLNPATPDKKIRKEKKERTPRGRIIQGEKGIGRFSVFKLGMNIELITRQKLSKDEYVVKCDFSIYDNDFMEKNGTRQDIYLDDLDIDIYSRAPTLFDGKKITLGLSSEKLKNGTCISISNLKGIWTERKLESLSNDIGRMQSLFAAKKSRSDFSVYIYKDYEHLRLQEHYETELLRLLDNNSVFQILNGKFDARRMEFKFDQIKDGYKEQKCLPLNSSDIDGLKLYRDRFPVEDDDALHERLRKCGSFDFGFYVFDFSADKSSPYSLDNDDKKIIKNHRIYLYRDGIRVYPYGDPDDDWLRIDAYRGTISAGQFLSNDQVVGYINITQKENKFLRDKTNREGLLEEGDTTEDFIVLIQSILAYIRKKPYAQYRANIEIKKENDRRKNEPVESTIDKAKKYLTSKDKKGYKYIEEIEKNYKTEKKYLTRRAETTEDLAGVGMSVETASHDIMAVIGKVVVNLDDLIRELLSNTDRPIEKEVLLNNLSSLRGSIGFIESQLKDIQLLFRSSKQRRKNIRVQDMIEKVVHIFKSIFKKDKIEFKTDNIGSPLVIKATDAVLLQLLLNLFDNSIYWLKNKKGVKEIVVTLNDDEGYMIFSDNGPGINKDDADYIFEPFYSGKGLEGRGLGLYIARQLLERSGYAIRLANARREKILSGANFVIEFMHGDEE